MKAHLLRQLNADVECFTRSTGALTEDDSAFAPVDGVFTAAQQVAHAAQTIEWFFDGAFSPHGFNMDFVAADARVRAVTSLASGPDPVRFGGGARPSHNRRAVGRGVGRTVLSN